MPMPTKMTKKEAVEILNSYGMTVLFWNSMTIRTGTHEACICDYTQLDGYTVAYAIEVYSYKEERQVERFNIMR